MKYLLLIVLLAGCQPTTSVVTQTKTQVLKPARDYQKDTAKIKVDTTLNPDPCFYPDPCSRWFIDTVE